LDALSSISCKKSRKAGARQLLKFCQMTARFCLYQSKSLSILRFPMSVRAVTNSVTGKNLPVGKILCLGRNYRDHAEEMKAEVPTSPVVFLKPSTALLQNGGRIQIPPLSKQLHYEAEMVVVIGRDGKAIPRERAMDHVEGYAVGLDMTLRDLQSEAKSKGLPWSVAKGFDTSAPVSHVVPRDRVDDPHALQLSLEVNGSMRQRASTGEMIFRIEEIIAFVSQIFTLERGDLIFTGTPKGVGEARSGDTLVATLESVGTLTVTVG
jgi:acylpyruvate hydrolase